VTVPTSVEILLTEQINWLEREVVTHQTDPKYLRVVALVLLSKLRYIVDPENYDKLEELKPPKLTDKITKDEQIEIMLNSIMKCLNIANEVLRQWTDIKRKSMI
jgi:hypothetical protein